MSEDKKIIFSMINVSKNTPQGKQIIKDIYLSFYYGAKIGILVLNGAGKSTVMRIIAGEDQDFQGEVVFSPGYTVDYLPQEPLLDDNKTVKEIVQEGVQETVDILKEYDEINNKFMDEEIMNDPNKMNDLIDKQGKIQEKIDQLDAWDLDSKLELAMDALRTPEGNTPIKNLSGGERRRVALCRLLLKQPDILLLDEPTSALDPLTTLFIEELMDALKKQCTIIIVTHNMQQAARVSDYTAFFHQGRLIEYADSDTLFTMPEKKQTEDYITGRYG